MIAAETFVDLLKSGPHWLFELTTDIIFGALGGAWLWPKIKAHFHHDIEHQDAHELDEEHK